MAGVDPADIVDIPVSVVIYAGQSHCFGSIFPQRPGEQRMGVVAARVDDCHDDRLGEVCAGGGQIFPAFGSVYGIKKPGRSVPFRFYGSGGDRKNEQHKKDC